MIRGFLFLWNFGDQTFPIKQSNWAKPKSLLGFGVPLSSWLGPAYNTMGQTLITLPMPLRWKLLSPNTVQAFVQWRSMGLCDFIRERRECLGGHLNPMKERPGREASCNTQKSWPVVAASNVLPQFYRDQDPFRKCGQRMSPAISVNKGCSGHQAISHGSPNDGTPWGELRMEKNKILALDS